MIDGIFRGESQRQAPLSYHGGDLDAASARFPHAPSPWLDLSTGINPHAYPLQELSPSAWQRLPTRHDIDRLEQVAARTYGARDAATVVSAPGTQALIQLLPQIVSAKTVGIAGFTYAEHASVWKAAGASVASIDVDAPPAALDAIVVVNPNNPDGRLVNVAQLMALACRCKTLIVDEAFMDVMLPGHSLVAHLPASGTIVLRSFGKAYGLAGLRLGFAVASLPLAFLIRDALGPWAISGPAIVTGMTALADQAWLGAIRDTLHRAAKRLDGLLLDAGFYIIGGTPLFRLVSHSQAPALFNRLGEAGILVRPFAEHPTWLRFGIPASETEFARLAVALA